jgi:hypothetical protein
LLRDGLFVDVPKVAIVLKLRIPRGPQIPRSRELIENVFFDSEQLGEDPKGHFSRKNLDLFHCPSRYFREETEQEERGTRCLR